MDFSDQLSEQAEKERIDDSPGASLLDAAEVSDNLAEEKTLNNKFQSSYDKSGASDFGPSLGDYDYKSEFESGNSFVNTEGIKLSNRNFANGAVTIAGYGVNDGTKITNEYEDDNGRVSEAASLLSDSNFNTQSGTPIEDTVPLTSIALEALEEGKSFEEFSSSTDNWNQDQVANAWLSAKQAGIINSDINNVGSNLDRETAGVEEDEDVGGILTDISESVLVDSKPWIDSGTSVLEYFDPGSTSNMSQSEINDASLSFMSDFNWNLGDMFFTVRKIIDSGDPELAKSFLFMMKQNEETDVSWASVGRAADGLSTDLFTYATIGGGVLISRFSAIAMRAGLRKILTKAGNVVVTESALGATVSAQTDIGQQSVEGLAGERTELDAGQTKTAATVGGVATAVLGAASMAVGDPVVREFSSKIIKKARTNLKSGPSRPSGGKEAQRGSVGVPSDIKQVEFKSRLGEELDNALGTGEISGAKLKRKIQLWISEGKVNKSEVDWSQLNMISDSAITKTEAKNILELNRPVPVLTSPVGGPRYSGVSLSLDDGSYRERLISVDKTGTWSPDHFSDKDIPPGNTFVGHVRFSSVDFGGSRGTMLLEGQSDLNKVKVTKESDRARYNELRETIKGLTNEDGGVRMGKEFAAAYEEIKTLGHYRTPSDNAELKQIDKDRLAFGNYDDASDEVKVKISALETKKRKILTTPPNTPFRGKQNSPLLFRSAVMEAMNNGDEFLSWPSSLSQISIIEGWGEGGTPTMKAGASKFLLKEMPKLAKSHGMKVESFVPDQYKDGKVEIISVHPSDVEDLEDGYTGYRSRVDFIDYWSNYFGYYLESGGGGKINIRDEEGGPPILEGVNIDNVFEHIKNMVEFPEPEWSHTPAPVRIERIPLLKNDNKFFRVVFTPEMKAKWRENGASMYGMAAAAAGVSLGDEESD